MRSELPFSGASTAPAARPERRRLSARSRTGRGALAALTASVVAMSLSSCFPFAFGGDAAAEPAGSAAVDFEGVQSATIQIEARGTFITPEGGYEGGGRGSGFIISPDGLAVTNNHVVVGAGTLDVWRAGDTSQTLNAKVLGASECLDLAVIDLDGEDYPSFAWAEETPKVATDVYTAGFPLGDPTFNMTRGIISKADKPMDTPWASIEHTIEHDARIRGGNSGGPLVDTQGRVVGVNYAGNDQYDQNLAIAGAEVRKVLEQLIAGENVLSLGINGTAITDEEGNGLGVWANSVASGSIADKAGVEPGDLLTRMEGVSLGTDGTMAEYCDVLRTHGTDATLSIDVYRPSEDVFYRGQVNGEPLEAVSVPQSQSGTAAGNGGGGSGGSASEVGIETVIDDTGSLQVDVPTNWSGHDTTVLTGPDGVQYAHIEAAPDLAAYQNAGDASVPGMSVIATNQAGYTPGDWLTLISDWAGAQGCELTGEDVFDDGYHDGDYRYFAGCGSQGADVLALAGYSKAQDYMYVLTFTATNEADLEAMNTVLGSFIAQF